MAGQDLGTPPLPPLPPYSRSARMPTASVMQQKFDAAAAAETNGSARVDPPYKPCLFFFYGTLMDPSILQSVLDLSEPPTIQKGRITGFKVKMWGIYPTLVPGEAQDEVVGTASKIDSCEQFLRLRTYETSAYDWCYCTIELEDGSTIDNCRTFCWAGSPKSRELEEGVFDLKRWQRYFKPSVVGKTASSAAL